MKTLINYLRSNRKWTTNGLVQLSNILCQFYVDAKGWNPEWALNNLCASIAAEKTAGSHDSVSKPLKPYILSGTLADFLMKVIIAKDTGATREDLEEVLYAEETFSSDAGEFYTGATLLQSYTENLSDSDNVLCVWLQGYNAALTAFFQSLDDI